jgi:hypothetical protein
MNQLEPGEELAPQFIKEFTDVGVGYLRKRSE